MSMEKSTTNKRPRDSPEEQPSPQVANNCEVCTDLGQPGHSTEWCPYGNRSRVARFVLTRKHRCISCTLPMADCQCPLELEPQATDSAPNPALATQPQAPQSQPLSSSSEQAVKVATVPEQSSSSSTSSSSHHRPSLKLRICLSKGQDTPVVRPPQATVWHPYAEGLRETSVYYYLSGSCKLSTIISSTFSPPEEVSARDSEQSSASTQPLGSSTDKPAAKTQEHRELRTKYINLLPAQPSPPGPIEPLRPTTFPHKSTTAQPGIGSVIAISTKNVYVDGHLHVMVRCAETGGEYLTVQPHLFAWPERLREAYRHKRDELKRKLKKEGLSVDLDHEGEWVFLDYSDDDDHQKAGVSDIVASTLVNPASSSSSSGPSLSGSVSSSQTPSQIELTDRPTAADVASRALQASPSTTVSESSQSPKSGSSSSETFSLGSLPSEPSSGSSASLDIIEPIPVIIVAMLRCTAHPHRDLDGTCFYILDKQNREMLVEADTLLSNVKYYDICLEFFQRLIHCDRYWKCNCPFRHPQQEAEEAPASGLYDFYS